MNLQLNGVQYHWYNRLALPVPTTHLTSCSVWLGLKSSNSWRRNSLNNSSVAMENRWIILAQKLKPGMKFYTNCISSRYATYIMLCQVVKVRSTSIPCTLPCVCYYHSDSDSGGGHSWLGVTPNILCNMTKVQTHDYEWLDHVLRSYYIAVCI